ncbi:MAG: hypothetical protein ABSF12_17080, partial [Bryobacteraceae bacterium]
MTWWRELQLAATASAVVLFLTACTAQPPIDPQLASEIAKIKAIDNHAHPVRPGDPPDTDFDALPVDHLDPYSEPVRTRSGSPI